MDKKIKIYYFKRLTQRREGDLCEACLKARKRMIFMCVALSAAERDERKICQFSLGGSERENFQERKTLWENVKIKHKNKIFHKILRYGHITLRSFY